VFELGLIVVSSANPPDFDVPDVLTVHERAHLRIGMSNDGTEWDRWP
jgi:hypothetical protein